MTDRASAPPEAPRPIAPPPRAPRPSLVPWVVLALCLVGGLVAWLVLVAPFSGGRLRFTNRLIQPVQLAVDGGAPRRVAPGATVEVRLRRANAVVAEWAAQPPTLTDGSPLGERLSGRFVLSAPRGVIERAAVPVSGNRMYFAPLLTNLTGATLSVRVNSGLVGARNCCVLPAAATRVPVGYWPLWLNSSVEVWDSAGRRASFRDLGPHVTAASGAVGLRFNARDLR
jgi:hypothetical protein